MFEQIKLFGRIISSGATRFYLDDGFSRACALAYSSLLALVPFTAMSIQFLGSFNIGKPQALDAIRHILERVLPVGQESGLLVDLQNQIFTFLETLGSNVKDLNALTIAVLLITTVALFNTIQSAMDDVWRVQSRSSIVNKIVHHWVIFTAWILLIVISVYWTAKFTTISEEFAQTHSEAWRIFSFITPTAIAWFALTFLYLKVPSTTVLLKGCSSRRSDSSIAL